MKILKIPKFEGGLNKNNPVDIKDNQFEELLNFFYDSSKILTTRRGTDKFGDDPDGSPTTSYIFHKRDDGGGKIALKFSGTNLYKYDETLDLWTSIKSGLAEFEPTDATRRTRWSHLVYKNVIYTCNGVDNYMSITIPDGVITEYAALPKVRYLAYLSEVVAGFGEDLNPITLYYSAAAPADGTTINTNAVVIGGDEQGKGTGLFSQQQLFLAAKEKKIYEVDLSSKLALPLDAQNGLYSHRALAQFGNTVIYYNDLGLNKLYARSGTSGGGALAADSISNNVQPLLDEIQPKYYNSNCGHTIEELNNYYFSFDTTNEDTPDVTLVLSALTNAFTQYSIPPAYQYGKYEMDTGEIKHLIASATTGQMYEIETGFDDDGIPITFNLKTKQWDLGSPEEWKDFEFIEIYGKMSQGGEINCYTRIDSTLIDTSTIDNNFIDITQTAYPIGTKPLGLYPIGGGTGSLEVFPYKIRIPLLGAGGGQKIQLQMLSTASSMAWTFEKVSIGYNGNVIDVFPTNNIA
jgi:hypothetical protein